MAGCTPSFIYSATSTAALVVGQALPRALGAEQGVAGGGRSSLASQPLWVCMKFTHSRSVGASVEPEAQSWGRAIGEVR